MKGTPLDMLIEMAAPVPRLALCWKVTQAVGGAVMTWTDHDVPILDPVDGLTYQPVPGGSQSDIEADVSMQAPNLNIYAAAELPNPTTDTVRAGDWDYARALVFNLCWADPSKGRHILKGGTIGQVSVGLTESSVEIRGLLQAIAQSSGDLTQPGCRHRLGDGGPGMGGCNNDGTIDPAYYSVTGTVTDVTAGGTVLEIPEVFEAGLYAWGRVLALDGANEGRSADVKSNVVGSVTLHLPFPWALEVGASVQVFEGCDGARETCINRFNNILNFDGEPWLPGPDKMVQVARST
jgi:uncharacterized phage protein (TIGR02218 family)